MNRIGSMTLIATLFLLMIVAILMLQINVFKSERQQKRILIDDYRSKIERMK